MIDASPEAITLVMVVGLLVGVATGFPLGLVLGGIAMATGLLFWSPVIFPMFYERLYGTTINFTFLAVPLFIFMGVIVERSGVSTKLFHALYLWLGPLPGGLAIATIFFGTILAATVGVVAASVTMLGLIAMPAMLSRGYGKELASGACCAGGTLGILIPPSVMLIFYGPMANISVGQLFFAAFLPGFLLSALYCIYIAIWARIRPEQGPPMPREERTVPLGDRLRLLATSLFPPTALVAAVLGSIFFGIATPTEAAAVGSLAAVLMAAAYRNLTWTVLRESILQTASTFSMVFIVVVGAQFFVGVFLGLGCGNVVTDIVLAVPGKWGSFLMVMVTVFILGMFIDWMGIVLIVIPIVSPIAVALGFDPLWYAMMIIVNLQMSFLSPPFAYSIFFLKAVTTPEMNVDTSHIIRGVIPFIVLIGVALVVMAVFPQIITWLPGQMLRAP